MKKEEEAHERGEDTVNSLWFFSGVNYDIDGVLYL